MLDLHAASELAGIMGALEGAALGGGVAYHLPDGPLTFAALHGRARAALAALRDRGVAADEVLALSATTAAGLLPALAACSAAGAVLLPLPAGMAPGGEARALATRCGAVPMPEGGDGAPADAALDGPQARDPHRVCLVLHGAGTGGELRPASLGAAALLSAARGLLGAHPLAREDVVLSDAEPASARGLVAGGLAPLLAGAGAVAVPHGAGAEAVAALLHRHRVTVWETSPAMLAAVLAAGEPPRGLRLVLVGGAWLPPELRAAARAALGCPARAGYALAEAPGVAWEDGAEGGLRLLPGHEAAIRPVPALEPGLAAALGAPDGAAAGEVLLRGPVVTPGYHRRRNLTHNGFEGGFLRTGDLGWLRADGTLVVRARLREATARNGAAVLLDGIDRALAGHPAVRDSHTVLLPAGGRAERVVTAVVPAPGGETGAEAAAEEAAGWLRGRDLPLRPERVVRVAALPRGSGGAVHAAALARLLDGRAEDEVVAALLHRRFRRNPPADEAGLRARVRAALLDGAPLRFVMLWGCGPRADAGAADRAAIAALGDLLAEARPMPHVRATAHVLFTDVHATSNGHSPAHQDSYFGAVEAAARGLPVTFERLSACWTRDGLTAEAVRAFEDGAEFAGYWDGFPLRDRFILQATRHSAREDAAEAARHYLATCRMERMAVARAHPDAVFLTYNGPEFDPCFPPLPTLYVYPGPRGPTVKPWFVE